MLRKPALIAPSRAHNWRVPCAALLMLLGAPAARAQPDANDKTVQRTEHIVTQPARDVGVAKDKIPPILQQAVEKTYAVPRGRCRALTAELTQLDAVLGPDFDRTGRRGDDKLTQLAQAGGEMVVNSLIPFRGIVREVSGAAAVERCKRAAVNAGLARRGFLRGLAQARKCRLVVTPPAK